MRRIAWLTLPLLAACSSTPTSVASTPSPGEAACAAQADQDPAVRTTLGIEAGNLDWQWQNEGKLAQIKKDAITRCLRARGLAPKGGVERPT